MRKLILLMILFGATTSFGAQCTVLKPNTLSCKATDVKYSIHGFFSKNIFYLEQTSIDDTIYRTICAGGRFDTNNSTYRLPGVYSQTWYDTGNQEHTLYIDLTVNDTLRDTIRPVICAGGRFDTNGITYRMPGVYTQRMREADSCYHNLVIDLAVNDTLRDTIYRSICTGEQFDTNGYSYNTQGVYTQRLRETDSCYHNLVIFITDNHNPPVVAHFSGDTAICFGQTANINVFGGDSYLWSTGDTSSSIAVNPSVTTTYYVTSDSVDRCSSVDSFTVRVIPVVNVTFSGDSSICVGDTANIIVSGGESYLWGTGDTTSSITVTPSTTATYFVTADSVGKCSTTDSFTVVVKPYVNTIVSNNSEICSGSQIALSVRGGSSHRWSTGQTTQTITVAPLLSTVYYVTSDSVGKCSVTDSVKIIVRPNPRLTITGDTSIIIGETATLIVSGADRYVWSTGATTNYINVSPYITTSYSVVGTNGYGCNSTVEATIVVNPNSIADASELDFKVYPIPAKEQLTVECEAIKTITVYNMLGKEVAKISADGESQVAISVKDFAQGVYVLSLTDTKGNTGRKTFIIR